MIRARGNSTSRDVDTAEFVRHWIMPDAKLKDIKISTEEVHGERGPSQGLLYRDCPV